MSGSADLVRITAIAAGGDGVGRLADGRALFAPRTAPGDLIDPVDLELRGRFARARQLRIVEPGADRVEPACAHYLPDRCGGCQLQHLTGFAQQAIRSAIVGDALRRIGHLEAANPPIQDAEQEWGYRTKLTLAVKELGRKIGLRQLGAPDRVFDLVRCEIAAPALNALWASVSRHRRLLPTNADRLVLRLARDGSRHLIVECGRGPVWGGAAALRDLVRADGETVTIWWQPESGAARVVAGSTEAYPATVFEQVHPRMGDTIRRYAVDALGDMAGRLVWDLYAGIGETSRLLLGRGARVESLERDQRAVSLAGPAEEGSIRRHVGSAEDAIGRLGRPDFVLTNPPRIGMDSRVVGAIGRVKPRRLVYVSCDPATLARDLGRLVKESELRLVSLRAFNLFPQTAHVESVAVLEAT